MGIDISNPLSAILDVAGKVIDRVFPNPVDAANAKLALLKMQQDGELQQMANDKDLALGQVGTNNIEAASNRLFVSGWRPFIGWTCGFVFAFKYIFGPGFAMICQLWGHPVTLPDIPASDLLPVMMGMLGLGVMRTAEKVKGVA